VVKDTLSAFGDALEALLPRDPLGAAADGPEDGDARYG